MCRDGRMEGWREGGDQCTRCAEVASVAVVLLLVLLCQQPSCLGRRISLSRVAMRSYQFRAVPCYTMLCCDMPCPCRAHAHAVPRHAMPCACPCRAMPCCDIPSHPILSHAIPSYPMPCQSHAHLIPGFVYVRRPIADIFEFERAGPGAGRRGDALPSHRGAATSTLH